MKLRRNLFTIVVEYKDGTTFTKEYKQKTKTAEKYFRWFQKRSADPSTNIIRAEMYEGVISWNRL